MLNPDTPLALPACERKFALVPLAACFVAPALLNYWLGRSAGIPWGWRLGVSGVTILAGALIWKACARRGNWAALLLASTAFVTAALKLGSFIAAINAHPLAQDWSEGSQFYYASLFFSSKIYGFQAALPVLHPAQYLTQSLPFLAGRVPIWAMRLWEATLWVTTPLITAWLLIRRLQLPGGALRWAFLAWSFCYLLAGPVYYHLFVAVILVLGAVKWPASDRRGRLLSLTALLAASLWAGISRVNWFPVPGMLAAGLYFIENDVGPQKPWRYLRAPLLMAGAGSLTALAAHLAYIPISGNPANYFASSYTSPLVLRRLLPNPTFPPGILLGILAVSLPLLALVGLSLQADGRRIHLLRLAGLASMLGVLFGGGLLVSTKVGGGSNLHNLDAFMVLLWITSTALVFRRYRGDHPHEGAPARSLPGATRWGGALLALAVLAPLAFAFPAGQPASRLGEVETGKLLSRLQGYVDEAVRRGGEVVFITNRHLLTFATIDGVRLVPEYEKVFLMEMAMAGNRGYLDRFYNDLKSHRFALIVSDPLLTGLDSRGKPFSAEDEIWNKVVARKILCYYQPYKAFSIAHLQLLTPRAGGGEDCP